MRGVVAELADLAAGAPDALEVAATAQIQIKAIVFGDFMFLPCQNIAVSMRAVLRRDC